MLKDLIIKVFDDEIKKELAIYSDKQKEMLNEQIILLFKSLNLNYDYENIDDALTILEKEIKPEVFPKLSLIIEMIKKSQKAINNNINQINDKQKEIQIGAENLLTHFQQITAINPEVKDRFIFSLIDNYLNPSKGFNIMLQNGAYQGLTLGNKEIVIKESLLEAQKYLNDLTISEYEFLNSNDAYSIIKEIVIKHRQIGHILAIACTNNWQVDYNSIIIKFSSLDPETTLQNIKNYSITKAEYEYMDFDIKINILRLFIEKLSIPNDKKINLLTKINLCIRNKKEEHLSTFYQSKIGDESITN